jgi:hypothetical protein
VLEKYCQQETSALRERCVRKLRLLCGKNSGAETGRYERHRGHAADAQRSGRSHDLPTLMLLPMPFVTPTGLP